MHGKHIFFPLTFVLFKNLFQQRTLQYTNIRITVYMQYDFMSSDLYAKKFTKKMRIEHRTFGLVYIMFI